jgi:hypothetical protein
MTTWIDHSEPARRVDDSVDRPSRVSRNARSKRGVTTPSQSEWPMTTWIGVPEAVGMPDPDVDRPFRVSKNARSKRGSTIPSR